jgi:Phage-related protein
MSIPAVRKGRQVIAGTLGAAPLVANRIRAGKSPERIERQLLIQPDPAVTRSFTLTWTLDDLIFYGVSWWRVLEFDAFNFPKRAERVHPTRIRIDFANGVIYIDGKPVADRELIRFDGPDEGVLTYGAVTLRTCLLLEAAVRVYAKMDIPLGYLQDEEGQLLDDEVQTLLDGWERSRKTRSTGYIPRGLSYKNPSFNAEQMQLADARGFQAQEIARLMNLPAHTLNAPTNDSLTYATTESNRRELVDLTFAPYIASIEQRLSMPDVTPQGTTAAFDLGKFLRGDIKSVIETGKAAVESKLMSVDEVRTQWLGLPPMNESEGVEND